MPPPHDQIRPRRRPDRAAVIKVEALPPPKHGAQAAEGRHRRVHSINAPGHVEVLAEGVRDTAAQAALYFNCLRGGVVLRLDDVGIATTQARRPRAARPYGIRARAEEPRLPRHPGQEAAALPRDRVAASMVDDEAPSLARREDQIEMDRARATSSRSPVTSARLKISPFREVVIDGSSTDGSAVRAVAVSTVAASLSSTHVDTGVRMNASIVWFVFVLSSSLRMSFRMRSWIALSTLASSSFVSARLEATPRQRAWRTTAFCISAASGVFFTGDRFAKMPRRKNAGSFTSSSLRCVSAETASSLGSLIDGRDAVEGQGVDRELCR